MNEIDPSRISADEHSRPPIRRELAIGAGILVAIMALTGVALWFVSDTVDAQRGSGTKETQAVLTDELLGALADDLGTHATPDELHAALGSWLESQSANNQATLVAASFATGALEAQAWPTSD